MLHERTRRSFLSLAGKGLGLAALHTAHGKISDKLGPIVDDSYFVSKKRESC